jgi:hypothetical protein
VSASLATRFDRDEAFRARLAAIYQANRPQFIASVISLAVSEGYGRHESVEFANAVCARIKLEETAEKFTLQTAAAWFNAPLPPRLHECSAVQSGHVASGSFCERCACGGSRRNGGPWMERNSRSEKIGDA